MFVTAAKVVESAFPPGSASMCRLAALTGRSCQRWEAD
jgi:hypothetical protein